MVATVIKNYNWKKEKKEKKNQQQTHYNWFDCLLYLFFCYSENDARLCLSCSYTSISDILIENQIWTKWKVRTKEKEKKKFLWLNCNKTTQWSSHLSNRGRVNGFFFLLHYYNSRTISINKRKRKKNQRKTDHRLLVWCIWCLYISHSHNTSCYFFIFISCESIWTGARSKTLKQWKWPCHATV